MKSRTILALFFAFGLSACGLKEAEFFEPTTLALSEFTGSVTGVVTVNGQGAAGVLVMSGTRTTTTGADGSYTIAGLPIGANTVSIVGVPSIATCATTTGSTTVVAGGIARLDFPCTAPTTGSVAGVVTVNGTGTAGIAVAVGARSATTGAGGAYRIDGIAPGSATATVAAPSGATCSPSAIQVVVAAGAVATANFACTAPTVGSLAGVVTINGTPTGGFAISSGSRFATTNGAGAYRIDSLPPGNLLATLIEVPPGVTCNPSSQGVVITAGQVTTANFACTRPTFGSLAGVVTVNGTPTGGFAISAGGRFATTSGAGAYRIDSLVPGSMLASLVEAPPGVTCSPSTQSVMITANQVATANFACTRPTTGSVIGRITINGLPASGLTVVSGLASATTLGDGSYVLTGLLPGTVVVSISGLLDNVTCLPASSRSVVVVAGEATTADFTCTQTAPTFNLLVMPSYRHLGMTSEVCATVTTSPAQPNAAYTGMLTGPGVLTASLSGTLNSSGAATLRFGIGSFGTYNGVVNVLGKSTNFTLSVTGAAGTCAP